MLPPFLPASLMMKKGLESPATHRPAMGRALLFH
jgi:hypothetical protein